MTTASTLCAEVAWKALRLIPWWGLLSLYQLAILLGAGQQEVSIKPALNLETELFAQQLDFLIPIN